MNKNNKIMNRLEKNKIKKRNKLYHELAYIFATLFVGSFMFGVIHEYDRITWLLVINLITFILSIVMIIIFVIKVEILNNTLSEYAKDILIKKYNHYSDMFLKAVENGEIKRAKEIHNQYPNYMKPIAKGMILAKMNMFIDYKEEYRELVKDHLYF